jgi:hypothetical protein
MAAKLYLQAAKDQQLVKARLSRELADEGLAPKK